MVWTPNTYQPEGIRRGTATYSHKIQDNLRGSEHAAKREPANLVVAQDFEPEVSAETESKTWNATTTMKETIEGWKRNGWNDLSLVTARRYEYVWKVHVEKTIGKRRIAS